MKREWCLAFTRRHGRSVCHSATVLRSTLSSNADQTDAFIRDELSKGRYDPAISKVCFEMLLELFGRTLRVDLGEGDGRSLEVEDVC